MFILPTFTQIQLVFQHKQWQEKGLPEARDLYARSFEHLQ